MGYFFPDTVYNICVCLQHTGRHGSLPQSAVFILRRSLWSLKFFLEGPMVRRSSSAVLWQFLLGLPGFPLEDYFAIVVSSMRRMFTNHLRYLRCVIDFNGLLLVVRCASLLSVCCYPSAKFTKLSFSPATWSF